MVLLCALCTGGEGSVGSEHFRGEAPVYVHVSVPQTEKIDLWVDVRAATTIA